MITNKQQPELKKKFSLIALGDISFMGSHADLPSSRYFLPFFHLFSQSDLVVANLESPLLDQGSPVPGKCTLRGSSGWARIMAQSGIEFVSLANNHMMDYGPDGLFSTMNVLEKAGIQYAGAGKNLDHARSPVFLEKKGLRIAVVARTCVEVSSTANAEKKSPGVAYWDSDELFPLVRQCKQQVDVVLILLHWGLEQYHYPSPEHRDAAAELVRSGADFVIGHHPHVVQGVEKIGTSLVAYSLGNFIFDEFSWAIDSDDPQQQFYAALNEENRKGMILKIEMSNETTLHVETIFTRIQDDGRIATDSNQHRKQQIKVLSRRLSLKSYCRLWRLYAFKREWDLRLSKQFSLSRLLKKFYLIRPRHFIELIKACRKSAGIANGKSTNPYD